MARAKDITLIMMAILLILAAISLQDSRVTGKASFEISGTFQVTDYAPIFTGTISNFTITPGQNITINLSMYFREPNNEDLKFSYTAMQHFTVSLDNTTGIVNLTPQGGWNGKETIIFTAYDPQNNNLSSNNVTLIIKSITLYYSNHTGITTNFDSYSDEELQNITSLTIENASAGKIIFAEPINISEDTDLNLHVKIGNNSIELNSSALPNFDRKATLSLYNLTFTDPRVLKDGTACPATECTEVNYSAVTGIFTFNVTGFTVYSAEETPVTPAPSTPEAPSGGGKGGATAGHAAGGPMQELADMEIDVDRIITDVRQNRVKKENIKVFNTMEKEAEITIDSTKDIDFVHFDKKIKVPPMEIKDIEITIAPTDSDKPDTYVTQLVIKNENAQKYIPLIINVQALLQLIDLGVEIYSEDAEVSQRENLLVGVKLYDLGESGKISVAMEWKVKDFNNNVLLKESDTIDVETQADFVKKIFIPGTMQPGEYVLVMTATYDGSAVVVSQMFSVVQKSIMEKPISADGGLVLLLVVVAFAILLLIIVLIFVITYERKRINDLMRKEDFILKSISEGAEVYDEAIARTLTAKKEPLMRRIFSKLKRCGTRTGEAFAGEEEHIAEFFTGLVKKEEQALKRVLLKLAEHERKTQEGMIKKEKDVMMLVRREASAIKNVLGKLWELEKRAKHGIAKEEHVAISLAGREAHALGAVLGSIAEYEKMTLARIAEKEELAIELVRKEGSMLKGVLEERKAGKERKILLEKAKEEEELLKKQEEDEEYMERRKEEELLKKQREPMLKTISDKIRKYEQEACHGIAAEEASFVRLTKKEAAALKHVLEKLGEYEKKSVGDLAEREKSVMRGVIEHLREYDKRAVERMEGAEDSIADFIKKEAHSLGSVLVKLRKFERRSVYELFRKEASVIRFVRKESQELKNVLKRIKEYRKMRAAISLEKERLAISAEKYMHLQKLPEKMESMLKNLLEKLREFEKRAREEMIRGEKSALKLTKEEIAALKDTIIRLGEYEKKTLTDLLKKEEPVLKGVLKKLKEYERIMKKGLIKEEKLAVTLAGKELSILIEMLGKMKLYEDRVNEEMIKKEQFIIRLLEEEGSSIKNVLKRLKEGKKRKMQ